MHQKIFFTILIFLVFIVPKKQLAQENRGAAIWPGETKTMIYKEASGESLRLDVLYPEQKLSGPAPVHVFMHGGGFKGGWRHSFDQPEQLKVFKNLAERGFVGVSIDYRLVNEADSLSVMHCVKDCKDAIRFLHQQSKELKLDASRLAVWGSSAGGHLALMTGLTKTNDFQDSEDLQSFSSDVSCIVTWYGVTDFFSDHYSNPHITEFHERFGTGLRYYEERQIRKMLSPINYLTTNSIPVLCIHGINDPIIPFEQSLFLMKKGVRIGANVSLISVLNTGHGWECTNENLIPTSDELAKITAGFIQFHLD
jgi:acetyl esterase/lipase